MKALDLFCGAGGASMGLSRAGFQVMGVDIKPQPHYPFRFYLGDAIEMVLTDFDFVWASPPCQRHSALAHLHPGKTYPCFIGAVRKNLLAWGGAYIIENVPHAPLLNPVQLCGSAFGLRVRRHRLFESNLAIVGTECFHQTQGRPVDVSGTGGRRVNRRPDDHGGNTNKPLNLSDARNAMGIDWMNRYELSQAVPPAYAEYLGRQVLSLK